MPANMRAQQRQLRKNYIGVVSDELDEQCAVELQVKSDHRVTDYLFRLMAVVRSRRSGAKQPSPARPAPPDAPPSQPEAQ
jgi:hypothetical protein